MAFFDDIGKKTKNLADSAKISVAISDEEKRLNNLYYQIGKLYVSLHPADYEFEFGGMMAQVSEVEAKLAEYRQQLQQIKGVAICPRCNAEVPRNSVFCPNCGGEMPRTEGGVELEKCVSCGNHVAKGMRFCTYCGKPMATQVVAPPAPVQADVPVQQEEPAQAEPAQEETPAFCTNCGQALSAGSVFCTECGTKVVS